MKFGNISNDMICSIEYENEFPQWRKQSISPIQQHCWGGSKASATTVEHSKSNYGIHFSYMFCTCETVKYERLLSFSGKSFFLFALRVSHAMSCDGVSVLELTLYRRRFQHPIRYTHARRFQTMCMCCVHAKSVHAVSVWTLCQSIKVYIYLYIFGILDLAWRWLRLRYSTHENTKCWTPSNGLHVHNTLKKWLWVESLKNVTLGWVIGDFQFYGPKNCMSIATSEFGREMEHIRKFTQYLCFKYFYDREEEARVRKRQKDDLLEGDNTGKMRCSCCIAAYIICAVEQRLLTRLVCNRSSISSLEERYGSSTK